jgi:PAS domain S-box-containing protein
MMELDPFSPPEALYIELSRMNNELANLQRQFAQQNAELRANQERQALAMDLARLATWEYDPTTHLFALNDPFYALYGATAEAEGGYYMRPEVYAQRFLHPDEADAIQAKINEALVSSDPDYFFQMERRSRRADGEERIFFVRARISQDSAGRTVKIYGAIQDITERKRAEQQVSQLNATLEQRVAERTTELQNANQELEAVSYSIAHDLTTPLRALNGYSRILIEEYGPRLDENGRQYLEKIIQASLYMARINDDLRKLLKISRVELKRTPLDLGSLARYANDYLRQQLPERLTPVEFICQDNLVVQADPHLMQTALEQLLENAWKFTQNCAYPVQIEFGCREQGGERIYFLKDNGIGFDMAFSSKLFGTFQRLHARENYEGTGIGLAIVQRIIRRHGGQVWAEGAANQGATFYFTLG